MPNTSQPHGFRRITPLIFMVITLRTLMSCRPYFHDAALKMGLTLMHRLIAACQAQ